LTNLLLNNPPTKNRFFEDLFKSLHLFSFQRPCFCNLRRRSNNNRSESLCQ